jgi:hypothetical protein
MSRARPASAKPKVYRSPLAFAVMVVAAAELLPTSVFGQTGQTFVQLSDMGSNIGERGYSG